LLKKQVKKQKVKGVPELDSLNEYGFLVNLRIEPLEWEKGKVLRAAGKEKYLEPEKDFLVIMDYIREDAIKRFGEQVCVVE